MPENLANPSRGRYFQLTSLYKFFFVKKIASISREIKEIHPFTPAVCECRLTPVSNTHYTGGKSEHQTRKVTGRGRCGDWQTVAKQHVQECCRDGGGCRAWHEAQHRHQRSWRVSQHGQRRWTWQSLRGHQAVNVHAPVQADAGREGDWQSCQEHGQGQQSQESCCQDACRSVVSSKRWENWEASVACVWRSLSFLRFAGRSSAGKNDTQEASIGVKVWYGKHRTERTSDAALPVDCSHAVQAETCANATYDPATDGWLRHTAYHTAGRYDGSACVWQATVNGTVAGNVGNAGSHLQTSNPQSCSCVGWHIVVWCVQAVTSSMCRCSSSFADANSGCDWLCVHTTVRRNFACKGLYCYPGCALLRGAWQPHTHKGVTTWQANPTQHPLTWQALQLSLAHCRLTRFTARGRQCWWPRTRRLARPTTRHCVPVHGRCYVGLARRRRRKCLATGVTAATCMYRAALLHPRSGCARTSWCRQPRPAASTPPRQPPAAHSTAARLAQGRCRRSSSRGNNGAACQHGRRAPHTTARGNNTCLSYGTCRAYCTGARPTGSGCRGQQQPRYRAATQPYVLHPKASAHRCGTAAGATRRYRRASWRANKLGRAVGVTARGPQYGAAGRCNSLPACAPCTRCNSTGWGPCSESDAKIAALSRNKEKTLLENPKK